MKVWQRSIVDEAGNVMPSASVEVRDQVTSSLVPLYDDYEGSSPLGNPTAADLDGFIRFYVVPGRYRIEATSGDQERVWENEVLGLIDGEGIEYLRTAAEISAGVTPTNKFYEPGHVERYGDYVNSSTDFSTALQAAFNVAGSHPVQFTQNRIYRANSTLTFPAAHGLKVEGNGATIDSYASGAAIAFSLVSGTTYPVENVFRDLNVAVNGGTSRTGWIVRTSYTRYERCNVVLRSDATSAKGMTLVADEANGSGPYYNNFVDCSIAWTDTDQTGVLFSTSAPIHRPVNANVWRGGRVAGVGGTAFVITGHGNHFYGVTIESTTETAFSFVETASGNCANNNVFGCYLENPDFGFVFGAGTSGNGVFGPFATGVATLWTDNGVGNYLVSGTGPWRAPEGVTLKGQTLSSDPNTIDMYQEGTFTPSATFATPGDVSITAGGSNSGRYTRIGNRVFFDLDLDASNISFTTASGDLRITGLPFASAAGDPSNVSIGFTSDDITYSGSRVWLSAQVSAGQQYIVLTQHGTGVASTNVAATNLTTANPLRIQLSGSYSL